MNRRGLFKGLFGAAVALPAVKAAEFGQVAAELPAPEAPKSVPSMGSGITHTSMIHYDDIVRDGLRQIKLKTHGYYGR